jgi:hypothetical protein
MTGNYITLDGIEYVLNPGFDALHTIEKILDASLLHLAQKLIEERLTLQEITVIIEQCMEQRATHSFLKEALIRNGLCHAISAIAGVFTLIFEGRTAQQPLASGELKMLKELFDREDIG